MRGDDLIKRVFAFGPVFFGLGFVAPLIAQSMEATGLHPPGGLSTIVFGLLIGGAAGLLAKIRGSWI